MSVIASQRKHQGYVLLALCNSPVTSISPYQGSVKQSASQCCDIIIFSQTFHETSHSTLQWAPYTWPWPLHTVQALDKERVVVWQPGDTTLAPLRLMNLWGCERQLCERMEVLVVKHCKSIIQNIENDLILNAMSLVILNDIIW